MGRRQVLWENLRQGQKWGPLKVLVYRGKELAADMPDLEWCILPQDWLGWDSSWCLLSIANGVQTTPEIWERKGKVEPRPEALLSVCSLCLCRLQWFSALCSKLCYWVLWGHLRETLRSKHGEHRIWGKHSWTLGTWVVGPLWEWIGSISKMVVGAGVVSPLWGWIRTISQMWLPVRFLLVLLTC